MAVNLELNLFERFLKILEERRAVKTEFVVKGAAEDYAEYKQRVGELNELEAIKAEFEMLMKAFDVYS